MVAERLVSLAVDGTETQPPAPITEAAALDRAGARESVADGGVLAGPFAGAGGVSR